MQNQPTRPDEQAIEGKPPKTELQNYLKLREHLSENQNQRLVSSLAIAIQRARENRAPQTVTIRINEKGYVRYIDPTDNHGAVE